MSSIAIIGHNLDIDLLLKKVKLKGYRKAYKGTKINKERTLPYSYISKQLSPPNEELSVEIRNIIKYLKRHKHQFLVIKEIKEVEYITINFYSDFSMHPESKIIYSYYFPANFIGICGELGISIEFSHYI